MRAVVQRVRNASVTVAGETVAEIGSGLVVILGVAEVDTVAEAERLAGKVARLRIFENDESRFDRSLVDVSGEALVVSQFTLIADSGRQKGTRPDSQALRDARKQNRCTNGVSEALRELGIPGHKRAPSELGWTSLSWTEASCHDHPRDVAPRAVTPLGAQVAEAGSRPEFSGLAGAAAQFQSSPGS